VDENRFGKIILIRHGKPLINPLEKIVGSQLSEWVQRYDHAPIDLNCPPPLSFLNAVDGVHYIVTSPLRRSVESAKMLVPELGHQVLLEAREAELPIPQFMNIKMSARTWCAVMRLAWFLRGSTQVESLKQAKERAEFVAKELEVLAKQQGSVLLLGHGIMNLLIGQKLRDRGWKSLQTSGRVYWKFSEYAQ
jgi:Histidine phosphatase superfamily (branch 1)